MGVTPLWLIDLFPPPPPAVCALSPGPLNKVTQIPTTNGSHVVEDATCDTGSGSSVSFDLASGRILDTVAEDAEGGNLGASGQAYTMAVPLYDDSDNSDSEIYLLIAE